MSIPIEDVRPGWYWVKKDACVLCAEVYGKDRSVTLIGEDDVYGVKDFEFLQRIEPPGEGE